jgi:hypothetical protein
VLLGATQGGRIPGQTTISVWMATDANGRETAVTAFRLPGNRACPPDPRQLWPKSAAQLLYGFEPAPVGRWDKVVRFSSPVSRTWTVCGYEVDEGNTRFMLPYVVASMRITVIARASGPPAVRPRRLRPWRRCAGRAGRALDRFEVRAPATGRRCAQVAVVARDWLATYRRQGAGGPRDNWGFGWFSAGGVPLSPRTYPALRFSELHVAALRQTLGCREAALGGGRRAPLDVRCGSYGFRVNLDP